MTGKYLAPSAAGMPCLLDSVRGEKFASEPLWPDHLSACLRQPAVGTDQRVRGGKVVSSQEEANQPGAVMEKLVRASSAASGR